MMGKRFAMRARWPMRSKDKFHLTTRPMYGKEWLRLQIREGSPGYEDRTIVPSFEDHFRIICGYAWCEIRKYPNIDPIPMLQRFSPKQATWPGECRAVRSSMKKHGIGSPPISKYQGAIDMNDKTVIRIAKRTSYTVIARTALQDNRLSFAARGLLAYLLSKPDDWSVQIADIQRAGDIGRDKAYALLGELRKAGYVVGRQRYRLPGGQWGYTPYYVFEEPQSPLPEKPYTVNQDILHSTDIHISGANFSKNGIDPIDFSDFRAMEDLN